MPPRRLLSLLSRLSAVTAGTVVRALRLSVGPGAALQTVHRPALGL